MGKYLAQFVQFNLTSNQSVGEFARFYGKRADVAGQLFRLLVHSFAKHHLEHAVTDMADWTEDQCHEVRINGDGRERRGGK